MKDKKVIKQDFDLSLYYIYELLRCTDYCVFDDDIKNKIDELAKFIENRLFSKIPHGYDIYDTKCVYYTYLEPSN